MKKLNERNFRTDQIVDSFQYVFQGMEFLGYETNTITNHFNAVKNVHSCELVMLNLEMIDRSVVNTLNAVRDVVYNKKLSHGMIDFDLLSSFTEIEWFHNTLYSVNPLELFALSDIELISYSNYIVMFIITFPVILKQPAFGFVNIVEALVEFMSHSHDHDESHSFLIPFNMGLFDIEKNVSLFFSTNDCVLNNDYIACVGNIPYQDLHCIKLLLTYGTKCRVIESPVTDFHVTVTDNGALIDLSSDAYIVDNFNETIVKNFCE